MGITSSMYVALTGMRVSQAAMEVASHNIANVNTEGFSRQRINLSTLPTWNAGYGQVGLGVDADNVSRYTDQFLVRSLVMTGSTLGHDVALKGALDNLELFFNESGGNGVNQAMSDFFGSWSQLADEANSQPYREELIEYTQSLASQLALRRTQMDELRTDVNKRIDEAVTEVNKILAEIASLNAQITAEEDPERNRQANDLRDSREELTRQLGEYMDIEYYEDPHDGQIHITNSKGIPLVLKGKDFPIRTNTDSAGDVTLHTTHNENWLEDITGSVTGGAIGGWLEFRDQTLDGYYKQYDSFVDTLIFNINDQHAQGAGLAMYSEAKGTTLISNLPSARVEFPGDDNDIKITALVPHVPALEPYDDFYTDPENIEIRFEKSQRTTSEITSTVAFNDDPAKMRWEVVVTLPVDTNGNVSVTARELCDYINSERSQSASDGVNHLPPRTTAWKVGDFISAEGLGGQSDTGRIVIDGPNWPDGTATFKALDRTLQNVLPQGGHLSYGSERALLMTTLKHTDNDVLFTAAEAGAAGELVSVEYWTDGSAGQSLRVDVVTTDDGAQNIRVRLATDAAGRIISTAGDVAAAVNSHTVARTLVAANTPEDETGLGVVDAMERTFLDRSGYFTIVTYPEGGEPSHHKVVVNPDDTMEDVLAQIGRTYGEGIPGLRVEIATDRHGKDSMRIIADDGVQFGYAGDSSGALAALGLNTILTGSDGSDIGVNQALVDDRSLINAGRIDSNGVVHEGDNTNALEMNDLKDRRLSFYHRQSATLSSEFNSIYANIGADVQAATRAYDFTEGVFGQLQDRLDSIAGVNLDEELADILRFQYMYQAAAKMISTIDTMMETLLAMR
jgi:flagellar hook-associated protein FlgK